MRDFCEFRSYSTAQNVAVCSETGIAGRDMVIFDNASAQAHRLDVLISSCALHSLLWNANALVDLFPAEPGVV
jgi:hypothetical protein